MPTFNIKQNDTSPALRVTLRDGNNNAVDVSGATIVYNMAAGGVSKVLSGSVTINDGPTGDVEYRWQTGDTDTPGTHEGEFEVTFAGGAVQTYPNSDEQRLNVLIAEELG